MRAQRSTSIPQQQKEQMLAEISQLQAQCKEREAKVATQRKGVCMQVVNDGISNFWQLYLLRPCHF